MDDVRPLGKFQRLEIYLTIVHDLSTWSPDYSRIPPFTAFCALADSDASLEAFAEQLISTGCKDVVAWGPRADEIHDVVDHVFIRMVPEEEWPRRFVGTTIGEEDFDSALWSALFSFCWESDAVVAIASPEYVPQLERRLRDPEQLSRDVVGE